MAAELTGLSKHPSASFGEVASLSLQFIFILLSGSLMGLLDRLILARYSLEALEAGISGVYLLQIFQITLIRVSSSAQIFVGQFKGSGELNKIGPAVWQMIWFSFLSTLIVIPISLPLSSFFFANTSIQEGGKAYFHYLISVNFLFPLGAALASFSLGQGKTRKVFITSLVSHAIHLVLDLFLIFGFKDLIPPLGVKGAAISAIFAQLFFCLILFWDFLKPHHRQLFGIDQWSFQWDLFKKYSKIGFPRGGSKLILLLSWISVAHIMIHKNADYLAILAFGGSINLFYTCFTEGISQALTTIGAYLFGAKQFVMEKLFRSASIFLFLLTALLAIPCIFFPDSLIFLFFKNEPSPLLRQELYLASLWIWALFVFHGLNLIGLGLLNSYGDTLFQMVYAGGSTWFLSFLPVYFLIGKNNAPPNQLWMLMAVGCLITAIVYYWRLRQKKWETLSFAKAF